MLLHLREQQPWLMHGRQAGQRGPMTLLLVKGPMESTLPADVLKAFKLAMSVKPAGTSKLITCVLLAPPGSVRLHCGFVLHAAIPNVGSAYTAVQSLSQLNMRTDMRADSAGTCSLVLGQVAALLHSSENCWQSQHPHRADQLRQQDWLQVPSGLSSWHWRTGISTLALHAQQAPPTGPPPSVPLLQQLQLPNKLQGAVTARPLPCRSCVLQQDTAGAAARATEAAQELLRQASRDGQVPTLEGRRLVSCVSSMRLDALPRGTRDELIAYTAFFAALEVSSLMHDQRLAYSGSRQVPPDSCRPCALVGSQVAILQQL